MSSGGSRHKGSWRGWGDGSVVAEAASVSVLVLADGTVGSWGGRQPLKLVTALVGRRF